MLREKASQVGNFQESADKGIQAGCLYMCLRWLQSCAESRALPTKRDPQPKASAVNLLKKTMGAAPLHLNCKQKRTPAACALAPDAHYAPGMLRQGYREFMAQQRSLGWTPQMCL